MKMLRGVFLDLLVPRSLEDRYSWYLLSVSYQLGPEMQVTARVQEAVQRRRKRVLLPGGRGDRVMFMPIHDVPARVVGRVVERVARAVENQLPVASQLP